MNKVKVSARISEKLANDVEAIALAHHKSKAAILINALEGYLWRKSWLDEQNKPTTFEDERSAPR